MAHERLAIPGDMSHNHGVRPAILTFDLLGYCADRLGLPTLHMSWLMDFSRNGRPLLCLGHDIGRRGFDFGTGGVRSTFGLATGDHYAKTPKPGLD